MQDDGAPLDTAHGNRLCVAHWLERIVLLHILDELAGDVVDAHSLALGWCNAVQYHTVTDAVGCGSGFGSDGHRLSFLSGHHDLPVLRMLNFYGAKVSGDHALARENALQRDRSRMGRRARSWGRCAGVQRARAGWIESSPILLVQRSPLARLCSLRDFLTSVGLYSQGVLADFLESRAIAGIVLRRPVSNFFLNGLLAISRIGVVAEPLRGRLTAF